MVDDKIDIQANLVGSEDFDRLPKNLKEAKQHTKEFQQEINRLKPAIKKATAEWKKYNLELRKASGGRSLGQTAKIISAGSPVSQLNNAQTSGQINNLKAQSFNREARLINAEVQQMKELNRSARNRELIQAKTNIQLEASNNLSQLGLQIEGQKSRILQLQNTFKTQATGATKAQLAQMRQEQAALNNLLAKEQQLLQVKRQRTIEQSRINKVDSLLGDNGAALLKIQSGLFLNYALMSQAFQLFQFGTRYVIEFDEALRDLQAVVVASDKAMEGLSDTFINISKNTKFSAVEIANAAVVLGQAGLEAAQIKSSMESIVLLATASGSDLKTSVDVTTSALTVFRLEASEAGRVADTLTGALNLSKLTMDKLSLGIQYAGNVAAEAGTTLEELVAILGGVSNAGIKSGSTIGTGIARLFTQLQAPTAKFENELKKVGLTLADVDVKAKGMTGVLETLRDAGFGSANAFEAFEIRAARGFLAASRNTETIRNMERQLALSGAAAEANATQMKSLANSGRSLRNSLGAIILEGADPLKDALITLADVTSSVLDLLSEIPVVVRVAGSVLAAAFGGLAIVHLTRLTRSLFSLKAQLLPIGPSTKVAAGSITLLGKSAAGATLSVNLLGKAFNYFKANPIVAVTTGLFTVIEALNFFQSATGGASKALDEANASFDEAKGQLDSTKQTMISVNEEVNRLIDRYSHLTENSDQLTNEVLKLQGQFGDFTDELRTNTINTVEDLIRVLTGLQVKLRDVSNDQLRVLQGKNAIAFQEQSNVFAEEASGTFFKRRAFGNIGGIVGQQNANLLYSSSDAREEATKILKDNIQTDISILDNNQLTGLEKKYTTLAESLGKFRVELYSRQSQETIGSNARNAIEKELSEVQILQERIKKLASSVRGQKSFKDQFDANLVNNNDSVQNATSEILKVSKQISAAKAKNDKQAIEDNIKLIKDLKNQFVITEESTEAEKEIATRNIEKIAEETGVSIAQVKRTIQDSLVNSVNEESSAAFLAVERLTEEVKTNGRSAARDLSAALRDIENLTVENAQRQVDLATMDIDNRIAELDATIENINNLERGSLASNYSDAELNLLEDEKFRLETERIRIRKDALQNLEPVLERVVSKQKELLDQAKKGATSGSPEAMDRVVNATKSYNEALDKQIELKNELSELNAKYNARTQQETEANFSLSEQLRDILSDYYNQEIAQKSIGNTIKESITGQLNNARTSFGNFISDWVKGTATAGDAFRNFATSVIESMIDMASQQAATGIFGLLTKAAGSVLGGLGGSVYDGPIGPTTTSTGGFFGLKTGGMVKRAALGYSVTGTQPRDSVLASLMPGEFVLRKSAVDMIGAKNLSKLNAQGNRQVSFGENGLATNGGGAEKAIQTTNVYVVSEQNKPAMTRNDVIVTISEDLSRNGSTAKLVKRIVQQ